MKVHADISLASFYKCTIWSYLQVSYILLREAYIANTRNDTSGTSGDSDKLCNSFKFTYKAMSDVEFPPTHAPTHTAHAHTRHTCAYTHTHMSSYIENFPKIILLPGPRSAFHHFQNILQETKCSLRAGLHQLFIKLKGV